MHKEKTTPSDTEAFINATLEEFDIKVQNLLYPKGRDHLSVIDRHQTQSEITELETYIQGKKHEYAQQYRGYMVLLGNLGRGKREPVTIGVYMQKLDMYRKIVLNKFSQLLNDVEKRIINVTQTKQVA